MWHGARPGSLDLLEEVGQISLLDSGDAQNRHTLELVDSRGSAHTMTFGASTVCPADGQADAGAC